MKDIHEAAEEVARTERNNDNEMVLTTGVVLGIKPVNRLVLSDLMRKYERPKPPLVFNKDIGRAEENTQDPDYISRMVKYDTDIAMGIMDIMFMLGTTVISVPTGKKGLPLVDDNWDDGYDSIGIDTGKKGTKKRYLSWLKYIAATGENDPNEIALAIGKLSGVAQEDVETAASLFRHKDK
jgi:hypothetical protein